MTEEVEVEIAQHQQRLSELLSSLPLPEMTTDSDRGESYLRGNGSAYLQLAIEALNAARGQSVYFGNATWLRTGTWSLTGFLEDAAPGSRIRSDRSYWSAALYAVGMIFLVLFLVGIYTSTHWIYMILTTPAH